MNNNATTMPAPPAETARDSVAAVRACPACGGTTWTDAKLAVDGRFPLLHCRDCGLGALRIAEGVEGGFDEYWTPTNQRIYADAAVVEELAAKYRTYFHKVAPEVPNKRFLDVGSGAGISIGTAAALGFEPLGVEPSAHAVALSRKQYDVPVVQGLLGHDDELPRDHGMLALWDVIEHVEDPEALVRACHAHLAPGGVFLLETPDEGTLLRRIICAVGRLGPRSIDARPSIYYRAHRFYFTRAAMTRLLERCGFAQIRYFGEHTMFQKELRKKALYGQVPAWKLALLRVTFAVLKAMPMLSNKMVVVAVKTSR